MVHMKQIFGTDNCQDAEHGHEIVFVPFGL